MKKIYDSVINWITNLLGVSPTIALVILCVVAAVVLAIIVLAIVLIVKASKRKKAAKSKCAGEEENKKENENPEYVYNIYVNQDGQVTKQTKEEVKTSEQKVEEPVEEAKPQEEEKPVEEKKEENKTEETSKEPEVIAMVGSENEEPKEEKKEEPKEEPETLGLVDPTQEEPKEEKPVKKAKPAPKKKAAKPEEKPVEEKKEEPKEEEKEPTTTRFSTTRFNTSDTATSRIKVPADDSEKKKPAAKKVSGAHGKFEVFPVAQGIYIYRLRASNGEMLVVSELYTSEKGAIAAIDTVKKNVETGNLQVDKDKHKLWQFKLFAQNKRLLVVSANYSTKQSCMSASESFKKFAMTAQIATLEEDSDHLFEQFNISGVENKEGGKIQINEYEDGTFDFSIAANNGAILCTSSDYSNRQNAMNGIIKLKDTIKDGTFFVVKDKNNSYQFKLYSSTGRCVVIGEAYKNKNTAISAAHSMVSFIDEADLVTNN